MKKIFFFSLLLFIFIQAAACRGNAAATAAPADTAAIEQAQPAAQTAGDSEIANTAAAQTFEVPTADFDSEDIAETVDVSNATIIALNGTSISVDGAGASANGAVVTISSAGIYQISGTLLNGQVIVDSTDEEPITLVLAGVNITYANSAPIYVANADKVILHLSAGSENVVSDGTDYIFAEGEDEPNAAIFSKDDLTINGIGSLTVNANYNNGIASKDDLKITGGTISVNAVNDGIKGRDSIAIKDGMITVIAGADGLQANNDEDAAEGYIVITGGSLTIEAGLDGSQAETNLLISGGTIEIVSGGGSIATSAASDPFMRPNEQQQADSSETDSLKGIKAGTNLTISGGEITISARDDALHANQNMQIEGGELMLASGDDGIHADTALTISSGVINITEAYEGLESAAITIYDGNISMVTSDDGINASTGGGDSMMMGGWGMESGNATFVIHGGTVVVDAGGDGLDANGTAAMTGGTLLINGPTNNGNGAVDYLGSFQVTGGFLVAVGSAGMAQAPSQDSTQYAVLQTLNNIQSGGTIIHLESADGTEILTFQPTKEFQSILISSPELQNGETYLLFTGGQASGEASDGLYLNGSYQAGVEAASFTITSIITGYNGGGMPGGQPGGQPNRPPGRP